MTLKPIRTAADHTAATEKLKSMIASNRSGARSDDIEVLVAIIEKYERQHFSIEAPTPIAAIKLRMDQGGLTPRHLEPFIGSRARVSEVLAGNRSLTVKMIRALHDGLGIPYESLIGKTEVESADELDVPRPVLKRLQSFGLKVSTDHIGEFIHQAFGNEPLPGLLARRTRTQRASAKTDDTALLLWQAAALVRAAKTNLPVAFDRKKITARFLRDIAKLSAHANGPAEARKRLAANGIILLINPVLPGTFLDGAAMLLDRKVPVVVLTLRHDRVDNFWFTLLHELAHIARHYEALLKDQFAFFDDLEMATEDDREQEADDLAQESLIPSALLELVGWHAYSSNEDIEALARLAGVHVSIAAGRWQRVNSDYRKFSRLIERNTIRQVIAPDLFDDSH